MAADQSRDFQAEQRVIQDAAECIRNFVDGDGSPIVANQCVDGLDTLPMAEFDEHDAEVLRHARIVLEQCEDGTVDLDDLGHVVESLDVIGGK